jgi:uncharacterized protein YcbK (DUF882 family)
MLRWKKGSNVELTKNFSSNEFDCHCSHEDCRAGYISKDLIEEIQKLRTSLGLPLKIQSAYRCTVHNYGIEKSAETSWHVVGHAADISCGRLPVSMLLSELNKVEINDKNIEVKKYKFDQIIPYLDRGFIHVVKL